MTQITCDSDISCLFVTQITSHGGTRKNFEVMTGTLPLGTLLAAILYQGYRGRNYKFWNILSADRYICILHMQVLVEYCYI